MQDVLKAMLQLQNKLNTRTIGGHWVSSSEQDWHLAISQECAEGVDHLGWKWWAKQVPDPSAALVEVVDILHFALSAEIHREAGDITMEALANEMAISYADRTSPVTLDGDQFNVADGSLIQLFQLISGLASVGRTNIGLIFLLGERLGLTPMELTVLYRQKATLNLFRQDHGYKDGSYIKHWAPGTEDNVYLATLSQGINWGNASAQDLFYGRLNVKYLEVLAAAGSH